MPQASLSTQFKKPVTPIPGVFRVEIWSEGIDGRRITGEQQPCPVNSYLPGFLALWAVFSNILAALLQCGASCRTRRGRCSPSARLWAPTSTRREHRGYNVDARQCNA